MDLAGWEPPVKYRLLEWLACPRCRATDLTLETTRTRTVPVTRGHFTPDEGAPPGVDLARGEETDVLEGALHCGGCGAIYAIRAVPGVVDSAAFCLFWGVSACRCKFITS